jgi:hypothetical protein
MGLHHNIHILCVVVWLFLYYCIVYVLLYCLRFTVLCMYYCVVYVLLYCVWIIALLTFYCIVYVLLCCLRFIV